MMVIVLFGDVPAVIEDYAWRCEDATLLRLLNTTIPADGPDGADPNPDLTVAEIAAGRFNGRILQADDADYEEGAVY